MTMDAEAGALFLLSPFTLSLHSAYHRLVSTALIRLIINRLGAHQTSQPIISVDDILIIFPDRHFLVLPRFQMLYLMP